MASDSVVAALFGNGPHAAALLESQKTEGKDKETQTGEASCPAFGYLRGLDQRALAVEFRFRDGNKEWFSYGLLASWRHNPSVGLLLKFAGDIVSLVLIRGSNLDAPVAQGSLNLTDRGFQRHRILWVREMDEEELRTVGEGGPTIDRIEVVEFESHGEAQDWLKQSAPAFVRQAK